MKNAVAAANSKAPGRNEPSASGARPADQDLDPIII
jgi:hypothetical protein